MATKPSEKELNIGKGLANDLKTKEGLAKVLNAVGADLTKMGVRGLPKVVAKGSNALDTLQKYGAILGSRDDWLNMYASALVNRVAFTIFASRSWRDPMNMFNIGFIEPGEVVEEIMYGLPSAYEFDSDEVSEFMDKRDPKIFAKYYFMNYKKTYTTTVYPRQWKTSFNSWNGLNDLVSGVIERLWVAMNKDRYVTKKYMIGRSILNGNLPIVQYTPEGDTIKEEASSIITKAIATADKMTYPNGDYNVANLENGTPKSEQFLITTADFNAEFSVNVLATNFHKEDSNFMGNVFVMDSFAMTDSDMDRLNELFADDDKYEEITTLENQELAKVPCILVDRLWLKEAQYEETMTEWRHPTKLYWNYNLIVWKMFGISPFGNAVMFFKDTPTITSVTVAPNAITLLKNQQGQFTATVVGTGLYSHDVNWEFDTTTKPTDVKTTISPEGVVFIGADETLSSIKVNAISVMDSTKKGQATITVGEGA